MNSLRQLKHQIAKFLSFVPDEIMLRAQYFIKLKRKLNLKNPKRFTEKIQWYKAFYRNNEMLDCVDKFTVRDYVLQKLGTDKYLNTLYQVCDKADDIDFESLPNEFVIKTTDGGNGDNVFICNDKTKIDYANTIKLINSWRHKQYECISREWAYTGAKKSRIIVEKLLIDPNSSDGSIDDYKFLCYNGKFKYLWIDKDRYTKHRRGFWDENLKFLHNYRSDCPTFEIPPQLPKNIEEMITISEQLSMGFPFARIDFYNIEGEIIFGEITFYPWSGYVQYTPDEFDFLLGENFETK